MKLNVTQAEILATEIKNQIQKKVKEKVNENLIREVDEFVNEYSALNAEYETLRERTTNKGDEKNRLEQKFCAKMNISRFYNNNISSEMVLNKVQEQLSPSVKEIKSKIIMKSLFGSEQEMQEFLAALVREYTE